MRCVSVWFGVHGQENVASVWEQRVLAEWGSPFGFGLTWLAAGES